MSSVQSSFAPRGMVIRSAISPKIFTRKAIAGAAEIPILTTYSNGVLGLNNFDDNLLNTQIFEQRQTQASIRQGGQHNITGLTTQYVQLLSKLIYNNLNEIIASSVVVKVNGVAQQVQLSTYSLDKVSKIVDNGTSFYSDGYPVTYILTQPLIIQFDTLTNGTQTLEILNYVEGCCGDNDGGGLPEGRFYADYLYWDPAQESGAGAWVVGSERVKIGQNSGQSGQGFGSVAVGYEAGRSNQNLYSVAVGYEAGESNQSFGSVAIGYNAGKSNQGANSVAIGINTSNNNQGSNSVAIGVGSDSASYSIAIGRDANATATVGQFPGPSIVLNADSTGLTATNSGFYCNPVRQETVYPIYRSVQYIPSSKEVVYARQTYAQFYSVVDASNDVFPIQNNAWTTMNRFLYVNAATNGPFSDTGNQINVSVGNAYFTPSVIYLFRIYARASVKNRDPSSSWADISMRLVENNTGTTLGKPVKTYSTYFGGDTNNYSGTDLVYDQLVPITMPTNSFTISVQLTSTATDNLSFVANGTTGASPDEQTPGLMVTLQLIERLS